MYHVYHVYHIENIVVSWYTTFFSRCTTVYHLPVTPAQFRSWYTWYTVFFLPVYQKNPCKHWLVHVVHVVHRVFECLQK